MRFEKFQGVSEGSGIKVLQSSLMVVYGSLFGVLKGF